MKVYDKLLLILLFLLGEAVAAYSQESAKVWTPTLNFYTLERDTAIRDILTHQKYEEDPPSSPLYVTCTLNVREPLRVIFNASYLAWGVYKDKVPEKLDCELEITSGPSTSGMVVYSQQHTTVVPDSLETVQFTEALLLYPGIYEVKSIITERGRKGLIVPLDTVPLTDGVLSIDSTFSASSGLPVDNVLPPFAFVKPLRSVVPIDPDPMDPVDPPILLPRQYELFLSIKTEGVFPKQQLPPIPHPDTAIGHRLLPYHPGRNAVSAFKSKTGGMTKGMLTVDYYDGLGRPVETVRQGMASGGGDLATLLEYDGWGRKSKEWLPVAVPQRTGDFISSDSCAMFADFLYEGDSYSYRSYVYEDSPLETVVRQYGPGRAWHERGKALTKEEYVNVPGDDMLDCLSFRLSSDSKDTVMSVSVAGAYPEGSLLVTRSEDEDGAVFFQFQDRKGKTVLERRVNAKAQGKERLLDTYYIYNDFGELCAVLPPALSHQFVVGDISSGQLDKYAYLYKYDPAGNVAAKKLPGIAWQYYVYDADNNLLFSQDGEERQRGEWRFFFRDAFGRICLQGTCKNDIRPFAYPFLKEVYPCTYRGEAYNYGYSLNFHGTIVDPLIQIVNYYDNYSFMYGETFSGQEGFKYMQEDGFEATQSPAIGMLTGTSTLLLDADEDSGPRRLYSALYYDHRGRLSQQVSDNSLGGREREFFAYDFNGNVLRHLRRHSGMSVKDTLSECRTFEYDHAERLVKVKHRLRDLPEVELVSNVYDDLGRLSRKSFHNGSLPDVSFKYNIRSWPTSISSPLFSQRLHYTDGVGTPCYNGNISSVTWQCGDAPVSKGYAFSYDGLSRLTDAIYGEGLSLAENRNRFNEQVTGYDKNGNILGLLRYGETSTGDYGLIDNLNLVYEGNQLKSVYDNATNHASAAGMEFTDGAALPLEYAYDFNGNLTKDLNKSIVDIEYNFLNLPCRVAFENENCISYVYDANGTKLRTTHIIGNDTTVTDYCGNVIYENGIAKTLLTDAGFVSLSDNKYHYYLQDHQGNNRVVVDETGKVEERNEYYPFGGLMGSSVSSVQPYKYNGKELDRKGGLDWYDYGARHYDAALGRWHAVDPSSEKYYAWSPYNYCLNNPFKLIDPNGMWPGDPLLQPFGRYQYGDNMAVNSLKFIHNTVAAVVNTPINIINQLADETQYIYNNGVGSYLSSGTKNIGNAVSAELSYRVNTPIAQQAADTWQAMKDPENWENATATAALMLIPMKGGSTAGARQTVSAVTNGGAEMTGKSLLDAKDALRIENAATKIGKPIHVVGSRAAGKATAYSDWDYVIEGLTNKNWKSIKNSLPGAKSIIDNVPRNIDIIKEPLDITKPYIKINPK